MSDTLFGSMKISAYGMRAQGERIRMISENVANAETAAAKPGETPYSRKVITFKNVMDREEGIELVKVDKLRPQQNPEFPLKFMPDHPGADKNGYVRMPNVNSMIELMDMREAQRSYEANLGLIEQARAMMSRTIDILRA